MHEEVVNVADLKGRLKYLTHIAVKRKGLGYEHHYIIIAEECNWDTHLRIVHYTLDHPIHMVTKNTVGVIKIADHPIETVKKEIREGLFIIEEKNYPDTLNEFDDAVKRFKKRLGERKYSAIRNNCEHFARWVMTGVSTSKQIENASTAKKCIADSVDAVVIDGKQNLTVAAINGIGCSAALKITSKQSKESEVNKLKVQNKTISATNTEQAVSNESVDKQRCVKDNTETEKVTDAKLPDEELKQESETNQRNDGSFSLPTAQTCINGGWDSEVDRLLKMQMKNSYKNQNVLLIENATAEISNISSFFYTLIDHACPSSDDYEGQTSLLEDSLRRVSKNVDGTLFDMVNKMGEAVKFSDIVLEITCTCEGEELNALRDIARRLLEIATSVLAAVQTFGQTLLDITCFGLKQCFAGLTVVAELFKGLSFAVFAGVFALATNTWLAHKKMKQLKQENMKDLDRRREISKIMATVPGATAGMLVGASLGQTLIPIPGVGAVVGGFFGDLSGRLVSYVAAGAVYDYMS